ncbi:hypothetical protein [Actinomadura madurae]|uniref:hypothetical protein n=1 Tax=Actinomadura madurae TaxID=1993 RepID=UPI0020D20E23|nr:hypothetical protein [Actinomadura madurae]MCQ0017443.1 hypothetical protein [Actinomadura madurae]
MVPNHVAVPCRTSGTGLPASGAARSSTRYPGCDVPGRTASGPPGDRTQITSIRYPGSSRGCRTSTRSRACGGITTWARPRWGPMSTSTVSRPHARIVPPTRPMPTHTFSATDELRRTTTGRPGRSAARPPRPPCQTAVLSLIASRTSAPSACSTSRCGLASRTIPLSPRSGRPASGRGAAPNTASRRR